MVDMAVNIVDYTCLLRTPALSALCPSCVQSVVCMLQHKTVALNCILVDMHAS